MAKKKTAFDAPHTPSDALADVIEKAMKMKGGSGIKLASDGRISRANVVKALWIYIKGKKLQKKTDGRIIQSDALLAKVLGKKDISMFQMNKKVSDHLYA